MSATRLIVRGGLVIDGTGRPGLRADVLVEGARIAGVGRIDPPPGAEVIEAGGLTVAPGFIDIHSHSDFTLLVDPRAVSSISQGVTLEVIGNCGYGCAPIRDPRLAREVIYGFRPEVAMDWRDLDGYCRRLEGRGPAVNVAVLIPNGQLRLATVGLAQRPADADELKAMRRMLAEGIEQGAFGYSTGLEYATETGASEEEVTELCRVVAAVGGLYATHTRNRDEGAVAAVEEAVRTAERAGVRLQVSHITPRGGREDTERAIEAVEAARRRGLDAAFDMHTRLFGTTYLKAVLPGWAYQGGREALVRHLGDPETRARMKAHRSLISALGDWSRVVLLDTPAYPQFSRRSLAEIGAMTGKEPLEAAYDILLGEVDHLERPMVILHCYTEELLRLTYTRDACTVGSDATALAPDGPLAGATFHGAYSWASWFYRRMVRETRTFTPEEGIHMLTARAAGRIGLADRGEIRAGAFADLAVFDAEAFGERATTFEPNLPCRGMRHVVVNGVVTLRDGALTGRRAGAVLRRAGAG
ncbi:MAG: amidohydrolase family protein [Proteobacteria bacterium]|nr:amidohydrolase family protein [Pseudomonadota bacterium]